MKSFLPFVLALLAALSSFGQDFKASTQKGVDMKKFDTFSVIRGEVVTGEDSKMDTEQFYTDFKRVTIEELEKRGYTFTEDSTSAQLTVSYVVEVSRVLETENVGPLGQMPQRNAGDVQTQTWSRDFTRGSLIIAMEAKGDSPVWSSEGTMDIARTRGGNVLEYAIKDALSDFPDKLKKDRRRKRNKKG